MLILLVTVVVLTRVAPSFRGLLPGVLKATTIKPIEKYVKEKGYPIEKHEIETEDGFKLTYHRVPHGKQEEGQGHGHPVMLAHGILQSSAAYFAMDDGLGRGLAGLIPRAGRSWIPAKPHILFYDAVKDFNHLDYFYSKNVKSSFF